MALNDGLEAEARQRFGASRAYQEATRRTRGHSATDWARIHGDQAAIYQALAACGAAGAGADSEAVQTLVEQHRQLIDREFYPCSAAMHARLADLYEADARFAASMDQHGAGVTDLLVAAIRLAAAAAGADSAGL